MVSFVGLGVYDLVGCMYDMRVMSEESGRLGCCDYRFYLHDEQ